MRILNEQFEEIKEYDLTKGGLTPSLIIKSDATPIDNITKFAWDDNDYEDVLIYRETPIDILIQGKINELKTKLRDTDYISIKIVEGVATKEDYADILLQRQEWRKQINELEVQQSQL